MHKFYDKYIDYMCKGVDYVNYDILATFAPGVARDIYYCYQRIPDAYIFIG